MVDTEMAGGAGPGPSEPPAASRTLYIHNLYERARKEGACDSCTKVHRSSALGAEPAFATAELRKCLHAVFCQFGTVSQIHVSKTYTLRGQAWVVFDSVQAAEEAKTLMNGFPLYEKPLVRRLCCSLLLSSVCDATVSVLWAPGTAHRVCKDQIRRSCEGGRQLRAAACI